MVEKKCVLTLQPGPFVNKSAVIWSAFPNDTVQYPYIITHYGSWRGAEGRLKSLLSFDLSFIDPDAEIDSACIYLYNDPAAALQRWDQAKFFRITGSWDKNSVTWNNQPPVDENFNIVLAYKGEKNYKIDMLENVRFWVKNPGSNYGVMMRIDPEISNNALVFASGSHTSQALRPKLEVHYRVGKTEECNCKNIIDPYKPDSVIISDTVVFQPNGVNGIDAYITFADPDNSDGNSDQFSCGGLGSMEFRSLIKFEMSGLKNVIEVEQALLYLYYYNNGKDTICEAAELLQLTSAWVPATVSWNTRPTSSIVGKIIIPQGLSRSDAVVDITSLAAGWILYPQMNFGMEMRIKDMAADHVRMFCSSNYSDPARRPKLVVRFKHKVVNK